MALFVIELASIALLVAILAIIVTHERLTRAAAKPRAKIDAYWHGSERRKFYRFKQSLDATYRLEKGRRMRAYCRIADISEGGLRLIIDAKFALGSILDLRVLFPNSQREAEMEAKVVWCDESGDLTDPSGKRLFQLGVQFCGVPDHSAKILAEYIRSLTAQAAG